MPQQQTAVQQPETGASSPVPATTVQPEPAETTPPSPEVPATPAEKSPDAPAAPKRRNRPAGKVPRPAAAPAKKTAGGSYQKKRRRPSPVPVSMWLIPPLRLPFSTPLELLRWFITGINLWAVGAVVLCALAGWQLIGRFSQPRQLGVEQALAGGEGTQGLTYTVEQTGEQEAAVTGRWDEEAGQSAPDAELAAALCAALSPEEIYGHSDHLYRAIAGRFFEGKDFTLTITLQEAPGKDKEEAPEPIFTVTRAPKDKDWPQPDCTAAFARRWREAYDSYWLFGQGRKEDLGPPQSDPIIEEGDLPPEEDTGDDNEEEAPPLPDLEGEGTDAPSGPEDDQDDNPPAPDGEGEGEAPPSPASTPVSSASGSSSGGEEDGEAPEDFLAKLLAYAARFRGLSWEEAWELFWAKE